MRAVSTEIHFFRSWVLAGIFVLLGAAGSVLVLVYLPVWLGVCATLVILAATVHALYSNALLLRRDSVVALRANQAGVELKTFANHWLPVDCLNGFVSRWFCVLCVHTEGGTWWRVVICGEIGDRATLRRFRGFLRWRRSVAVSPVGDV